MAVDIQNAVAAAAVLNNDAAFALAATASTTGSDCVGFADCNLVITSDTPGARSSVSIESSSGANAQFFWAFLY